MRNRRHQNGYSLTELLVVVAIVGAMALVTIPAFMTFMQSNKMKSSMRNIAADLRSMRQRAITRAHQTAVCYDVTAVGAAQVNYKRTYYFYEGNLPFNSTTWTPVTLPGATLAATHSLDDVVYFPAHVAGVTPQTFTDTLDCSAGTSCTAVPLNGAGDGKLDIIFFPDGRVQVPSTIGQLSIKTDMNIPKPIYIIELTPSGRVQAQ